MVYKFLIEQGIKNIKELTLMGYIFNASVENKFSPKENKILFTVYQLENQIFDTVNA